MKKIKNLSSYQKGILILMIVMTIAFAVVYSATTSRVGFQYKNTIFVPAKENGNTVYTGKINGQQAHLKFQIRDADYAEPFDWEIAGRYEVE